MFIRDILKTVQDCKLLPTIILLCAFIALIAVGCDQKSNDSHITKKSLKRTDSLVYEAMNVDYNHALLVVDSLEEAGAISQTKTNFFRAQIFFKMGQELSAELYYKKALSDNSLYNDLPTNCYFAYDQLSTILTIKGDQQGSLATATEGYALAKNDESEGGLEYQAILLHDIGYCQMQLGRIEEAEKNFTTAYNTLKRLAINPGTYDYIYSWARVAYNIMDAYTSTQNFDKAEKWVVAAEEAINKLVASPQCPKQTADEYIGSLKTHQAIVFIKTGQYKRADEIYREFLKSDYSKTSIGIIDNSEYLETAERWGDLAKLTPKLDSLATSWAMPKSMYYLKTYLVPFYNAYLKSGQKEKAMLTAQRIVDAVDSIDEYERKHNAAELSIIYETKEKEAKIAEQSVILAKQRMLVILVATLLIIVFLAVFTLHRNKMTKRLADINQELKKKNDELTIANAQAQESSRMKTDFIQQVSHEIRTPLNILNGYSQILTSPDTDMDEKEKEHLRNQITENTERITDLVNKMLELSNVNSMTIIRQDDNLSAIDIANQAITDSGIRKAKHIRFSIHTDSDVENIVLKTNSYYAVTALSQILDNAQKFTKDGEVRLIVIRQQMTVEYIVEDTGIGIPPYEVERIFGEFVQLDEYRTGTGIGLAVARNVVRRLGGDIILDTTYTGGSRFIMTLPIEK